MMNNGISCYLHDRFDEVIEIPRWVFAPTCANAPGMVSPWLALMLWSTPKTCLLEPQVIRCGDGDVKGNVSRGWLHTMMHHVHCTLAGELVQMFLFSAIWAISKRERDKEEIPWHGTFSFLQLSWLPARTEAWFDVLYDKFGVRSGVIHPGKHIPATAGKIQLGEYGKFWKEVAENEVMFLHDGKPCAKPGHWAN